MEGPIEKVTWEEMTKAIQKMKPGKMAGPSEVSVEMITASGEIGIDVMIELYQCVLDGRGMPQEWNTSVTTLIFKGKGDVMSCGVYRRVKLLEHAMEIVEKSAGETNKNADTPGQYALWIYVRKGYDK